MVKVPCFPFMIIFGTDYLHGSGCVFIGCRCVTRALMTVPPWSPGQPDARSHASRMNGHEILAGRLPLCSDVVVVTPAAHLAHGCALPRWNSGSMSSPASSDLLSSGVAQQQYMRGTSSLKRKRLGCSLEDTARTTSSSSTGSLTMTAQAAPCTSCAWKCEASTSR